MAQDSIFGVDVSQWQGKINWSVTATKVKFAFIRTSYGTIADKNFADNWSAAKRAGIPRGAYLYYYSNINAGDQARAMINLLDGNYGELPLVVDVEEPKSGWTPTMRDDLLRCLTILEKSSGCKPLIYTGTWFWNTYIHSVDWAKDYALWIAQYPKKWTETMAPILPTCWSDYTFWQYSSTGHGADYGAASNSIDLDIFHGDSQAFSALIQ